MSVIDRDLLDLVLGAQRVFWAGSHPPVPFVTADPRIYDARADFRMASERHQSFEVAYLVERDLARYKQWPLILDEALRTLIPGGTLIVRSSQSQFLTVFRLASFIRSWTQAKVALRVHHQHVNGAALAVFDLQTTDRRPSRTDAFTFGVITDGRKPEYVEHFIRSVRALDGLSDIDSEIVVCGPESVRTQLDDAPDVRLVVQPDAFADRGWITRKKNLIVDAARYENLVIAHDRYSLAPDFLHQMRSFGGDFDVLVCRQVTANGSRMPDWVALGTDWNWSPPGMLEYGDYHPHLYVNGGVMIAKRHVLQAHAWNELLFWNQAEDVELTRRMTHAGLVPRLARHVTLVTADRPKYLSSFEAIPWVDDTFVLPSNAGIGRTQSVPYDYSRVSFGGREAGRRALLQGVTFGRGWSFKEGAATWIAADVPEIALRLSSESGDGYRLTLTLGESSGTPRVIDVNDHSVPMTVQDGPQRVLHADLPPEVVEHHNCHLRMRLPLESGDSSLCLAAFQLHPVHVHRVLPGAVVRFGKDMDGAGGLARGFSTPERWGVWAGGAVSEVRLTLAESPVSNIRLRLELVGAQEDPGAADVVGLAVNGIPVAAWPLDGASSTTRTVTVPAAVVANGTSLVLAFYARMSGLTPIVAIGREQHSRTFGLCTLTVEESKAHRVEAATGPTPAEYKRHAVGGA